MAKIILKETSLVIGDRIGDKKSLYYNFPSMEKLSNGEWIICCREIKGLLDPKGKIRTRRSSDEGKTWYDAISPTYHDEKECPQNGFLMCHITELAPNELLAVYMIIYTDESNPLFHPTSDGMQYTKVRVTKSFDNGKTWAKPKDIEYEYPDLLIASKAIIFSDGSIGIPCETHDIWDEGYKKPVAAMLLKSYDRGNTFLEGITLACEPSVLYGDARPAFDGNEVSIYFWTYNIARNKDTYIHRVKSTDNGKTWSYAHPINLKMQITSPLFLKKDLMVCACQDRFSDKPGIKAFLSYDGAMNWDPKSEITVFGAHSHPDGTNPFKQFTQFKFGYSTILKLSERRCAVCYWHDNSVTTSISVSILDILDAD